MTSHINEPCSSCVFNCENDGWNPYCAMELDFKETSIYHHRHFKLDKRKTDPIEVQFPCINHRTPFEMLKMLEIDDQIKRVN